MAGLVTTLKKSLQNLLATKADDAAAAGSAQQADAAPQAATATGSADAADAGAVPPEPLTVLHAWTPEPNAVKLQLNRLILPLGDKRHYPDAESTGESPLAQALFEIVGVITVEFEPRGVKVFMHEDADWDSIIEKTPVVVKQHIEMGLKAVEGVDPYARKKYAFGFRKIENARPKDEQMKIVQELLDNEINPAVAAHGGFFSLVDIEDSKVIVSLGGGCQGCGMVDVTLRQGVEQRMREVLPEMVALIDVTDHASGHNPYYQPGK